MNILHPLPFHHPRLHTNAHPQTYIHCLPSNTHLHRDGRAPAPPPRASSTGRASTTSAASRPGTSSAYETLLRAEALRKKGARAGRRQAPAPLSSAAHNRGAPAQTRSTTEPQSAEQAHSPAQIQSAEGRQPGANA
eukprot:scaffold122500_cov18-Tisochrysis_lutea.AAC.1